MFCYNPIYFSPFLGVKSFTTLYIYKGIFADFIRLNIGVAISNWLQKVKELVEKSPVLNLLAVVTSQLVSEAMILAVMSAINCEEKPEKFGLRRSLNPWPHDTGAIFLGTSVDRGYKRRSGIARSRVQTPLKSWIFQASLRNC